MSIYGFLCIQYMSSVQKSKMVNSRGCPGCSLVGVQSARVAQREQHPEVGKEVGSVAKDEVSWRRGLEGSITEQYKVSM